MGPTRRVGKQYYAKEQEVRTLVAKVISDTGMKEEHLVDYPAISITHVFVELDDKNQRQIRQVGKHEKI